MVEVDNDGKIVVKARNFMIQIWSKIEGAIPKIYFNINKKMDFMYCRIPNVLYCSLSLLGKNENRNDDFCIIVNTFVSKNHD